MAFPDLVIVKPVCWPVTISCVSPRRPGENGFYQTSGHLINGLPGRRFFLKMTILPIQKGWQMKGIVTK